MSRREIEGGLELLAQCDDETTAVVVLNPTAVFPSGLTLDQALAAKLIDEHVDRCVSCRRWAERSA